MMKYLQVFTLLVVTTLVTSDAWAQYGLYGSPGVVSFSPEQSAATLAPRNSDPGYGGAATPPYTSLRVHTAALNPTRAPGNNPATPQGPGQSGPSVVDEMLNESSDEWPAPWGDAQASGPFGQAVASADVYGSCIQPRWYVSASALYMTRDDPGPLSGSPTEPLGSYVPMDWSAGEELRVGHRFGCETGCGSDCGLGCGSSSGGWTLEGVSWTLNSLSGSDEQQRISRDDEVFNVELNLIRNVSLSCAHGPFQMNWSLGPRYFQFDEDWRYASPDEGGIDDSISNTLIGGQVGGDFIYQVKNWRLYFRSKVGIYNNHIKNYFTADGGGGELLGPDSPVDTDIVSFLTELDAGLEWQFHPKWSTHLGYRATIVTGIGLADDQIPYFLVDTPVIAEIDHNAQLILHGGYAGLTYQF